MLVEFECFFSDFGPSELLENPFSAVLSEPFAFFWALKSAIDAPCDVGGNVGVHVVAALFFTATYDYFAHSTDACRAHDDGFLHAHGFEGDYAEGFIVAGEHCDVACCVVEDAFFFGDEVEAESDVLL